MRKKNKRNQQQQGVGGFNPLSAKADFYSGAPTERPLNDDQPAKDPLNSRKTLRHQKVAGREREKVDPREKAALIGILKAAVTLSFLIILFFMLWKGIKLYEESIWIATQPAPESSPVLREIAAVEEFDIREVDANAAFSERIEIWEDADRLMRSVENLLLRESVDEAIRKCQQVLQLNPFHIGALEYLGELYFDEEMFVEAVNTYIRLLSMDPARNEYQLALLKSLDAHGDFAATVTVAGWYQSRNVYDAEVQQYLARAHLMLEQHEEAAAAYERVLKDSPRDVFALESQAVSYMRLEQYDQALATLQKLVEIEFRDQIAHKRLVTCYAQLGMAEEAVQVMGKSAHVFGADTVAMWIQDPMMDPIRLERAFQIYADGVVTEEYRRYLEEMARAAERKPLQEVGPQLDMPEKQGVDQDILNPGK